MVKIDSKVRKERKKIRKSKGKMRSYRKNKGKVRKIPPTLCLPFHCLKLALLIFSNLPYLYYLLNFKLVLLLVF